MTQLETVADQVFETDVLVLGGGMGGCSAAINAAQNGARVLIVDKGPLATSGSGGMYPWTLHVIRKDLQSYEDALSVERGAVDGMVHGPAFDIFYHDSLDRMTDLDKWGVELMRDPQTGDYLAYNIIGLLHTFLADPVKKGLKPVLPNRALAAGAQVQEWTMATDLLVSDDQVVGATGLNIRTGGFYVFRAKSTILAAGTGVRLYSPLNGQPYMRWHCPYCTGDGHAMAYRAGAELSNMEFPCSTIMVKGIASPRAIAFIRLGDHNGYLLNALGERFMSRYDPVEKETTPRNKLCNAILSEKRAGRGPIFIDTREAPENKVQEALAKWRKKGSEAHLVQYLEAQGIRLGHDLIEVEVSEPSIYNGGVSGCVIDENAGTSLPGLYATGDTTSGTAIRGVVGALTTGWRAGAAAAARAKSTTMPSVDAAAAARERERVFAPLGRPSEFEPHHAEERLNQVMSEYVAHVRNEGGLNLALTYIDRLRSHLPRLGAKDTHGVLKALELQNLLDCGEMVARAALFRKESRCVPFHYRTDYPERDDQNWLAKAVVKKVDGQMTVTKQPL